MVAAVALIGGGVFLLAQSGGDEPSGEEQAYVDAFVQMDRAENPGYTDEQTRCLAEIVVDVIGLETLQDAASPEEIRDNAQGGGISDFGIRLTEDQATSVYDRAGGGCIDFRGLVRDRLRQQSLTDEQIECVDQYLTEDLLRDSVIAGIMEDQAAEQEASQAINEATEPCNVEG